MSQASVETLLKRGSRRLGGILGTTAVQVAFLAFLLIVWHLLVATKTVSKLVLPEPLLVVQRYFGNLWEIITGGPILRHVGATLFEAVGGFVIAVAIGVTVGALLSEFWLARVLIRPYLLAFNATPRIVFAPLVLVWFGFGMESKVALAASIAIFPVAFGTIAGLMASEAAELRLMKAYGATRWQTFAKLRFYNALPYIFSGLEMAMGLAFLGAVAGEFVGGSAGLGYLVLVSLETLDLAQGFAVIFLLSTLGFLVHKIMLVIQSKVIYWRTGDRVPL